MISKHEYVSCCVHLNVSRPQTGAAQALDPGGGGVLPYMGYIGMCGTKGYGFSAVLVINRISILAILPPFW